MHCRGLSIDIRLHPSFFCPTVGFEVGITGITGTIPLELMQQTKLRTLCTPSSCFVGRTLTGFFTIIEQLGLYESLFSGIIPSVMGNLTKLGMYLSVPVMTCCSHSWFVECGGIP